MIKKKEAIMKLLHYRILSRRGDSNARPPRPERGALPTALLLDRKARGNPEKSLNVTLRNLLRCEQIYICQCIALP